MTDQPIEPGLVRCGELLCDTGKEPRSEAEQPAARSGVGGVCPKCNGVPVAPEIPECHGCSDCDFTGTIDGFEAIQRMIKEGYEVQAEYLRAGICSGCGACSAKEAEKKCRPRSFADTGDYWCEGEGLWEDEREEMGGGGAEHGGESASKQSGACSQSDLAVPTAGAAKDL